MKLKNNILWLQGETYYQIRLLSAWVGCHLGEDWNRERICNLQILGGFHAYMGYCKTIGFAIEGCGKRYGTYTCLPITTT